MRERGGQIVIVSGPAGVGKTTICDQLLKLPNFVRSISATTRLPRAGERDNIDYIFMNQVAFERGVDEGYFLEWARVYDQFYGTPRSFVMENLRRGKNVICNIEVHGAAQIRLLGIPVVSFFLLPPNIDALRARLRNRNSDSEAEVEKRLRQVDREIARAVEYDYRITNDEIGRTVENIRSILESRDVGTDGVTTES